MPRKKKKPDLTGNIGVNPFVVDLVVPVNKKYERVINKYNTADLKEKELEATPYTKVFEVRGGKKQMVNLTTRGKEMLLFFMFSIDSGQDYLWIDRLLYMNSHKISSINTFKDAVRSLCDSGYIYPHNSIKDLFWINPHFFFKGSRIEKYRAKLKILKEEKHQQIDETSKF